MSTTGRPPRLEQIFQRYDPPLYFVTFCTHARKKILAHPEVHRAFQDFAGRGLKKKGVAIGRYVLMPEHLHLFVRGSADFKLQQWARMLKLVLTKTLGELGHPPPHWQRGFFDHLIRNSESYSQKWDYVWQNAIDAGLVKCPDNWPYQGEIAIIDRA